MVKIVFEVDKLAIAYVMQQRGIKDFRINLEKWKRFLRGFYGEKDELLVAKIQASLGEEYKEAEKLREIIEKNWRKHERMIINWLKELTSVDFKSPTVRICVVPFRAGRIPFREIPLIVVGDVRKGWGYSETIAHELAHILFNQNFDFGSGIEHPYVQLIEEEIAVRLGVRSKYFDYEIPPSAKWVYEAQKRARAWKYYLKHIRDFGDISQFIKENEKAQIDISAMQLLSMMLHTS